MTTSRRWLWAVVLLGAAAAAGAQSHPKELSWAVAEFSSDPPWSERLPLFLVRGWEALPEHRLSETEAQALRREYQRSAEASVSQQMARLSLDRDRKKLEGRLPAAEAESIAQTLGGLAARRERILLGSDPSSKPPESLPLVPSWPSEAGRSPWKAGDRFALAQASRALYLVTGSVRKVGDYLAVRIELASSLDDRVLSSWEGQFAPEEAESAMAQASESFRSWLLGRPWSGLDVLAGPPGAQVAADGVWHALPWSADDLRPGPLELTFRSPGVPETQAAFVLEPGVRLTVRPPVPAGSRGTLVLDTVPSGAWLYLDSRYLGPSPQSIEQPLSPSRVRAQGQGGETLTWEVGPQTSSPSVKILVLPRESPDVGRAKERFYWALAGFSGSLTATAFAGAWAGEQVKLVNAYAAAGESEGYERALSRYQLVNAAYGGLGVLTTGLFVWMMVELGDYLGAAQASLP